MQPKYGGMIIDIVSREIKTPQQQSEALNAVRSTILEIVIIVVVGYVLFLHFIPKFSWLEFPFQFTSCIGPTIHNIFFLLNTSSPMTVVGVFAVYEYWCLLIC